MHTGLSLLVFGGLAGALGVGAIMFGDPGDASPRARLALFEAHDSATPSLKARLKTETYASATPRIETPDLEDGVGSGDVPDLGIDAPNEPVAIAAAEVEEPTAQGDADSEGGVRINGTLVKPGESYGDVVRVASLERAPIAGLTETVNGMTLPRIDVDGRTPADAYARPFANPTNAPVVALVVGGLGINATHTKSAIDELPPEVTLSFAPDATRLQLWVNRARAAGHEVLIETPMEAYDYGRMKMHPLTLLSGDNEVRNAARLERVLGKTTGYFGLINYQGAKLGEDSTAMRSVLDSLAQRGLAFVDDGSLDPKVVGRLSVDAQVRAVRADAAIDAKLTAEEISNAFMELESRALEDGAALGAGYAFPITIEMAKSWAAGLEQKGIVLAPVSALTTLSPQENSDDGSVRTGSLMQAPVNSRG